MGGINFCIDKGFHKANKFIHKLSKRSHKVKKVLHIATANTPLRVDLVTIHNDVPKISPINSQLSSNQTSTSENNVQTSTSENNVQTSTSENNVQTSTSDTSHPKWLVVAG